MSNTQNDHVTISLVIPVFREGRNLLAVLQAVRASLDQCNLPYEIVLVDDGSNDDSWRVITDAATAFPAIRAFRLSRNFGKEAAVCAGLERARELLAQVQAERDELTAARRAERTAASEAESIRRELAARLDTAEQDRLSLLEQTQSEVDEELRRRARLIWIGRLGIVGFVRFAS